jgi:hypothetical protein
MLYFNITSFGRTASDRRNYLRNSARIKSRVVGLAHLHVGGLPGDHLRRRTPVPPPFSSIN